MRAAAVLAVWLAGCASTVPVERRYEGWVLEGRFVEPQAYAAFLRGALAEASGDARGAIAAYEQASDFDSEGTEIWTRLGAARCAADPRDRRADEAFGRALRVAGRSGRTWEAMATCALRRGDAAGARTAAQRATSLGAPADDANVLLAEGSGSDAGEATRARLVSLTLTSRDRRVAWNALSRWAESHGDVVLWVRSLKAVVRLDPARRDGVARTAEELAGAGEIAEARSLAAAAVDASDEPLAESRSPLAARLAVDEAISRGDRAAVSARASRARLSLDEAAARALIAGKVDLARDLASATAAADPSSLGAAFVFAAAEGRDVIGATKAARKGAAAMSAAALVAFGEALVHAAPPEQVRGVLGAVVHDAIVGGDDRVVRPAVDLVARGVLPAAVLPPEGAVELAAMGFAIVRTPASEAGLDARHAYLALALDRPRDPRAAAIGARLARVRSSDPIVAAAGGLVALAAEGSADRDSARALLAIDASDPLLAAIALRLANKEGDPDSARRARAALSVPSVY